jgi:hypothetical protein
MCLLSPNPQIQTFKTAIEVPWQRFCAICLLTYRFFFSLLQASRVLLRVDDVVQATRKERRQEQAPPPEEPVQD